MQNPVSTTLKAYERNSSGDGGIVTTTPDPYERNSALPAAAFVILAPVERTYTAAARNSSLQNLAKANAALKAAKPGFWR
jgi:hypothetical protein